MPRRNKFLEMFIPHFYQKQAFDIMLYIFIDTYKYVYPSVTIEEAAKAFMKHHKVDEDLYSLNSILRSYQNTCKAYLDAQKQQK